MLLQAGGNDRILRADPVPREAHFRMPDLTIPGIDEARLDALEAEAAAQGLALSALLQRLIDEGLARARRNRARAERPLSETEHAMTERFCRRGASLGHYRGGSLWDEAG